MDLKPAALRLRIRRSLKLDSDFNAFLLDYFKKEIQDRLAHGSADRVAKENLLFELVNLEEVEAALDHWEAAHNKEAPVLKDGLPFELPGDHRHDALLRRLFETCRVRERLRDNLHLRLLSTGGAQLRLIEVSYSNLGFQARYGLGVTDMRVDTNLLTQFLRMLKAAYLDLNSTSPATLVYSDDPPTTEAMAAAHRQYIALLSLDEYEMLLNLRPCIKQQTQRLLRDPRYPCALYVPQQARYSLGASFRFDEQTDLALDAVREWLHGPYARFVLILGDFGVGKTFLLHELARRIDEEKGPLLPLLCELRTIEKAQTLDGLLAQHMQQHGIEPIDPQALRHMLSVGKVVLFFDGFDELALRTSYERAAEHFETLLDAVSGQAKVVVTSRTQHFINDQQIKTVLAQRLDRVPCYVARLLPFEPPQILNFLRNKLQDEATAQRRYDLLDQVKDLIGLSHNPRMLGFIAELEERDLLAASQQQGNISAAGLYQLIVNKWLSYEVRRISHRVAGRNLDEKQLLSTVTRLASKLWCQTDKTVSLNEMEETVRGTLEDLAGGVHQLGSASLLVRDEQGRFSFLHQSVLEWLVAAEIAEKIRNAPMASVLGEQEMSDLMTEFLIGLLGTGIDGMPIAADWVGQVLANKAMDAAAEVRKQNALRLLKRMEPATLELEELSIDLSGQNLRGRDFMRQNLQGAYCHGADLTEALLVESTLVDADLSEATLARADLRGADLRRANLRRANLVNTNLMGADLRGADLDGAVWGQTKLVGALLDPDDQNALAGQIDNDVAGPRVSKVNTEIDKVTESHPRSSLKYTGRTLSVVTYEGILLANANTLQSQKFSSFNSIFSPQAVAYSINGQWVAVGDFERIRILDINTAQIVNEIRTGNYMDAVLLAKPQLLAISPNGQYIARTFYTFWIKNDPDDGDIDKKTRDEFSTLLICDVSSGAVILRERTLSFAPIKQITFSSDSQRVIWVDGLGAMNVVDVKSHNNRWLFSVGERRSVTGIAVHPDGQRVAVGSLNGTVQLWDVNAQQRICPALQAGSRVQNILFSPDSRFMAAVTDINTVQMWKVDVEQAMPMFSISIAGEYRLSDATFSPDGRTLAMISDGLIVDFWDVLTNRRRATLLCARGEWISFAPDGRYKFFSSAAPNRFWHEIDGCKFAPKELDDHLPGLRLKDDVSYFELPPWSPLDASSLTIPKT